MNNMLHNSQLSSAQLDIQEALKFEVGDWQIVFFPRNNVFSAAENFYIYLNIVLSFVGEMLILVHRAVYRLRWDKQKYLKNIHGHFLHIYVVFIMSWVVKRWFCTHLWYKYLNSGGSSCFSFFSLELWKLEYTGVKLAHILNTFIEESIGFWIEPNR